MREKLSNLKNLKVIQTGNERYTYILTYFSDYEYCYSTVIKEMSEALLVYKALPVNLDHPDSRA